MCTPLVIQGSTLFMLWCGDKDVGIKDPITFVVGRMPPEKKISHISSEHLSLFSFLENTGSLQWGGGG